MYSYLVKTPAATLYAGDADNDYNMEIVPLVTSLLPCFFQEGRYKSRSISVSIVNISELSSIPSSFVATECHDDKENNISEESKWDKSPSTSAILTSGSDTTRSAGGNLQVERPEASAGATVIVTMSSIHLSVLYCVLLSTIGILFRVNIFKLILDDFIHTHCRS